MTATLPAGAQQLGYTPQPMQEVFHLCPADEVLYGGSAGGGKSDALLNHFILECSQAPKTRAVLFRRTNPELQELRDRADELLSPHPEVATWHAREERWEFKNGSFLRFSHLQHYEDVHKHQGTQYTLIGFDEWTHFLPKQVEYLKSRNRSAHGHWSRILGASNPGSIGHAYIKDFFVEPRDDRGNLVTAARLLAYYDFATRQWRRTRPAAGRGKWTGEYDTATKTWDPCPPWDYGTPSPFVVWVPSLSPEEEKINETRALDGVEPLVPLSRCYIPARLRDNKYLYDDPAYHSRLARLPDNERKALLDGNWDIFEGAFFPDFRPLAHIIEGGWMPPAHWSTWASMDWGRSVPSAVYWHAQDPDTQHIVTYREMYGIYKTDREMAENIVYLTGDEDIRYVMADPAMWRADGNDDAISHADLFDSYFAGTRIKMMKADNNRVAGWARLKELLPVDPRTKTEESPNGHPYWRCTADCRNLIRTIPQQVYDEDRQDDLDTQGDDHACFVADTKVLLRDWGWIPVSWVDASDEVMTRRGWRRVVWAGQTADVAQVFNIELSTGNILTGTGNHPIWVDGKGWTRLDALRYGDILLSNHSVRRKDIMWDSVLRRLHSTVSRTGVTRNPRTGRTETIIAQVDRSVSAAIRRFIGKSGSSITGWFQMVATFIMQTRIRPTTTLATSIAQLDSTTLVTTGASLRTSSIYAATSNSQHLSQPRGIGQKQVVPGTENTPGEYGQNDNLRDTPANNAEQTTKQPSQQTIGSAPTSAGRSGGGILARITKTEPVPPVATHSASADTSQRKPVPVSVVSVSDAGQQAVYNLAVDGESEYFAEGVLVHNCDALRYGLMSARSLHRKRSFNLKPQPIMR